MRVEASTIDGILVVRLGESQIVASNVGQLRSELDTLFATNNQKVVLDLGPVAFLDSSGVGLLVAAMKVVSRAGGALRVAGLGAQPLALFQMVNLDRVMPFCRDVEEAVSALRAPRGGGVRNETPLARLPVREALDAPRSSSAATRVLVVDDEPLVCEMLKEILGTMRCEVIACQNGREGVDSFDAGRFDLVMTDLAMPKMSGWQLARAIRVKDPAVPIALFSAWGSQMNASVMRENGVDYLFQKPFEISMIRNVLMAALELGRERRARLSGGASPAMG